VYKRPPTRGLDPFDLILSSADATRGIIFVNINLAFMVSALKRCRDKEEMMIPVSLHNFISGHV
jgi:hypothetical protein